MKDAKGHGSDTRGGLAAHQDATVSAVPTKAGIDAMVERLRDEREAGLVEGSANTLMARWFEPRGAQGREARTADPSGKRG